MTQQEILNALNIDKSDLEAVKGAVAALNTLLQQKGGAVWPPPPPPPPTDPPLPMPQKPTDPDPDSLKKRQQRKEGSVSGNANQTKLDDKTIRSITYNRTLEAAKNSLEKAELAGADPQKIKNLKDAIAALEQLTEAVGQRSIQDLDEEEFDELINNTLYAIKALNQIDDELVIDSDEEHKAKVDRLANALKDDSVLNDLELEDEEIIETERAQAIKRQQNLDRINRARSNYYSDRISKYGDFDEFCNSLYKAIALQVKIAESEEDSWTAINQRYYNSGVLKKGKKVYELPSEKIPVIDFYFDVSGSWGTDDIEIGKRAQKVLSVLESKGKIILNTFYFSNYVSTDYGTVAGQGTYCWKKIMDNIRETKANNVVIMTDDDMDYQHGEGGNLKLSGCVWYLWKNGESASKIVNDLTGARGTKQFAFSTM